MNDRLMIQNEQGTYDRVRREQLQPHHVAYYDDHRHGR